MATTHAPMEVDDAAAAVAVFAAQVQRDHPDAEVHLARRKRSGKRVRQHVKDTHEVVAILNGEQVASKRCAPVSHTRSRTCLLPSAPPSRAWRPVLFLLDGGAARPTSEVSVCDGTNRWIPFALESLFMNRACQRPEASLHLPSPGR